MKRSTIFASLCILGLVLAVGCGSDKKSANPTNKATGDLNDPEFIQVRTVAASVQLISQEMLTSVYGLASSIATSNLSPTVPGHDGALKTVPGTLEFHESSMYWYRGFAGQDSLVINDSTVYRDWIYADSVQFMQGNTPVQYPDSTLVTAVKIGSRHAMTQQGSNDSLGAVVNITITGAPGQLASGGDAVINGNGYVRGHWSFPVGDTVSCVWDFNLNTGWQALAVNLDSVFETGGCPTGGSITYGGSLASDCTGPMDSLDFNGGWSIKLTYSGTNIAYVFENNTTRWTGSTTCGDFGQGVAAYVRPFAQTAQ